MERPEKRNDIECRLIEEEVADGECCGGGGWGVIVVHVWGETVAETMVACQCAFEIVGVIVSMVKELTWGTVGIAGSGGATGKGMAFV